MTKRKMFDENERSTPEKNDLSKELELALSPIFEKYYRLGFGIRDIEYVAKQVCTDIALDKLLGL